MSTSDSAHPNAIQVFSEDAAMNAAPQIPRDAKPPQPQPADPRAGDSAPITGGNGVNWRTLPDENAAERWTLLREWVEWFTVRYQIPISTVPDCWWQHGALVEELSALHLAHNASFHPSDTGLGPIGWHERLAVTLPRLTRAYGGGCTNGHRPLKPRAWANATDEAAWTAWTTQAHAH